MRGVAPHPSWKCKRSLHFSNRKKESNETKYDKTTQDSAREGVRFRRSANSYGFGKIEWDDFEGSGLQNAAEFFKIMPTNLASFLDWQLNIAHLNHVQMSLVDMMVTDLAFFNIWRMD